MLRRTFPSMLLFCWTGAALGGTVAESAGRNIEVPAQTTRLTGRNDVTDRIVALKPDLILDHSTIAPRYIELAKTVQQQTGIPPVLLDGSLTEIPRTVRLLGFTWPGRAEPRTLAALFNAALFNAALFNAVIYGRVLTASQLDRLLAGVSSLQP